ncbi:siderophore-interacting protein [Streptomyces sp. NBC_01498]|uniref:siderophore-interacting protein n=1 Tax=Streptomyces sp. NBC_01498 TaxID=2975870 RepID=UPI002E7AEC45|nr:siderophore-interacting protein [Streptomyces sp. NBC_01498]WTL27570.1 siderophore-interacting protein [Streptomyces sp. NBC_01498]
MTEAPFQFFTLHVLRTTRISPSFVRVTFGGEDIPRLASAGRDQRVKLFFPRPGQDAPVLPGPEDGHWWPAWRALDPAVRGIMRTYTVRELRRESQELDIDFAVHELSPGCDEGPATRWALNASPGDRVGTLAPIHEENDGYDFRPPEGADWILLTGDESALPALAGNLESLPPGVPARVWITLQHAADRCALPTRADARVTWLVREESAPAAEDAIRAADDLPQGTPYAWIAGESATVRAVRRHLVRERGYDRRAVKFTGYWRRGTSEDVLLVTGEDA